MGTESQYLFAQLLFHPEPEALADLKNLYARLGRLFHRSIFCYKERPITVANVAGVVSIY